MVSKLSKVRKHVSKKKGPAGITSLHENSRDALRLRKASARDARVLKTVSTKSKQNAPWLDRVSFFQDALPETLHPLPLEDIQALIETWLGRHDEEIATLKGERRAGRPATTRQVLLEQAGKAERLEWESGFWVPDLMDVESLQKLDGWRGDWLSLANLRFARVQRDGAVKESQFPPRGSS
jgi:translation machinery-associated protein 16